jgi:hypothetical protein
VACGVFLLFIAIVGLYGAIKQHQVALFFYMVVLFSIFVIQFSVACASLAASTEDELEIMEKVIINFKNYTHPPKERQKYVYSKMLLMNSSKKKLIYFSGILM